MGRVTAITLRRDREYGHRIDLSFVRDRSARAAATAAQRLSLIVAVLDARRIPGRCDSSHVLAGENEEPSEAELGRYDS